MVTGKAFATADAKAFAQNLKMLAATTNKAETAKVALSAVLPSSAIRRVLTHMRGRRRARPGAAIPANIHQP